MKHSDTSQKIGRNGLISILFPFLSRSPILRRCGFTKPSLHLRYSVPSVLILYLVTQICLLCSIQSKFPPLCQFFILFDFYNSRDKCNSSDFMGQPTTKEATGYTKCTAVLFHAKSYNKFNDL